MGLSQFLGELVEQMSKHSGIWLAASIGSVVMFVGTILAIPVVCVKLPSDYFVRETPKRPIWKTSLRTAIACVVVALGVTMLVLPGQGVLTILVGVSLLDFHAKRRWQRRLLARPTVRRTLNAIRLKAGKEPFQI